MDGIDSNNKRRHLRPGDCALSSGIEYSYVGTFCEEVLRRLPQNNLPDYHQFFFIPNLKAEAKVGYDLSIGDFRLRNRIRTMHKVINEKYCDQSWTFSFKYSINRDNEFIGDYGHFISLVSRNNFDFEEPAVNTFPYLIINICFCIHDYRRMGIVYPPSQITIPSFDSLLRTIIIDLRALREQATRQHIDIFSPDFSLKIFRRPERRIHEETSQVYLNRISNKTNINIECSGVDILTNNIILSVGEFFDQIDWTDFVTIRQR